MRSFFSLLILFIGTLLLPEHAKACNAVEPCRMGDAAEYLVLPPSGWDGKRSIGALIFVHGHRSSAAEMIGYRELAEAAHALGLMLVAPQGLSDSWATPGSPGEGRRDEVKFMAALLDDLTQRFPIDRKRLVGSGFSQGSSVIWEVACRGDGRFSAFIPIAGVWWQPMPKACTAPPRPMLHIHGTADSVMPMTGRNLRDRWKQGDVMQAFATMQRNNGCAAESASEQRMGGLTCTLVNRCDSLKPLALCLHGGDHHTNPQWFMEVKDWLAAVL